MDLFNVAPALDLDDILDDDLFEKKRDKEHKHEHKHKDKEHKLNCRKEEDVEGMSLEDFSGSKCCKKEQITAQCVNGVGFQEITCGKVTKRIDECA